MKNKIKNKDKSTPWINISIFVAFITALILKGHKILYVENLDDIINKTIFILCMLINIWSNKRLKEVNKIVKDLRSHMVDIEGYNGYQDKSNYIHTAFIDYNNDCERYENLSILKYRPNIENYINYALIDRAIKKDIISTLPGILTGLGILGTFLGLSIGLSNFGTGSTVEITNSIEPLMNGIKVAFYTSVYGMIFSLGLNLQYKQAISNAYDCVDQYLSAYKFHKEIDSKDKAIIDIQTILIDLIKELRENANTNSRELRSVLDKNLQELKENANTNSKELISTLDKNSQELKEVLSNINSGNDQVIKEITEVYIKGLSEQTFEQFRYLGELLEKNCNLLEKSNMIASLALSKNYGLLVDMGVVQEKLSQTVQNNYSFMERINSISEQIEKSYDIIREGYNEIHSDKEKLASIVQNQNILVDRINRIEQNAGKNIIEAAGKIERSTTEFDSKLYEYTQKTYKAFEEQLCDIEQHLAGTFASISDAAESVRTSSDRLMSNINRFDTVLNDKIDQIKKDGEQV